MTPDPDAQRRNLPLVITPGLNGYRVAHVGGSYYKSIGEFATLEEARDAKTAAEDAVRWIARRMA